MSLISDDQPATDSTATSVAGSGGGLTAPVVRKPLRVWPGWAILLAPVIAFTIQFQGEISNVVRFAWMLLGPLLCVVLGGIWWLGFSRARWFERLLFPVIAFGTAQMAAQLIEQKSGIGLWIYGVPATLLLLVIAATMVRQQSAAARWPWLTAAAMLGWLWFPLVRVEGFDGNYLPAFAWRWSPTVEQQLLATLPPPVAANANATQASVDREPGSAAAGLDADGTRPAGSDVAGADANPSADGTVARTEVPADLNARDSLHPDDWPGFRGPRRDGRVLGSKIRSQWQLLPPTERWRKPVGPAWSSFAIVGERAYTQEQHGEHEAVVCYDTATGTMLWRQVDTLRFDDVVAGPGPRATPTIAGGRVYSFGSKAVLNCLDAATGVRLWQRNLMEEMSADLPVWGFSGSPLVAGGHVIVYVGGSEDRGLVAFDAISGSERWHLAGSGMNFGSAQPGEGSEILFVRSNELTAIDAASGDVRWSAKPTGFSGVSIVQPLWLGQGGVVVPNGDGIGLARMLIKSAADGGPVTAETLWSTRDLKPSFNDFVLLDGWLYGFDQNVFGCINVETGQRGWKRGRYGFGQVLGFVEQGLLVVLSESGELILLAADPKQHRELGRLAAVSGKTWNHPAFAHGRLYVRNGEEAVCFDIAEPISMPATTAPDGPGDAD